MIEAAPKHFFSKDYVLRSEGGTLAVLDVSGWRERAELELDGVAYRMYREGLMSGAFILERDGQVAARAVKPSALRDRFEIELGGGSYTMRKLSVFRRGFGVFRGQQQVGSVGPASVFSRRVVVDLPADWPLVIQIYLFWLALLIWNREEKSSD